MLLECFSGSRGYCIILSRNSLTGKQTCHSQGSFFDGGYASNYSSFFFMESWPVLIVLNMHSC